MFFGYSTGLLWMDAAAAAGTLLLAVAIVGVPAVLLWPAEGSAYANSATLIRPANHKPATVRAASTHTTELERIRAEAAEEAGTW